MTLTAIKAAIVTALDTIDGLRVYAQAPEIINELPCAYVLPRGGVYDFDVGGDMTHKFEIVLLVRRAGDLKQAQEDVDSYLDATGTYSIKAAVDAAVLTSGTITVTGYRDYGGFEYPPGTGQIFLGVKFDVDVIT